MKYCIDSPLHRMLPGSKGYTIRHDADGVAVMDYASQGRQYNPVAVGLCAIEAYERGHIDGLRANADWLVDNMDADGVFWYRYDWSSLGHECKNPWCSAMAQGVAISALLRAREVLSVEYFDAAMRASGPFIAGTVTLTDKHGLWLREYVAEKSHNVLNGTIFAACGLLEIGPWSRECRGMWVQATDTIIANLHRFDLKLWPFRSSRYDDGLLIWAGGLYHGVHVDQLRWLRNHVDDSTEIDKYIEAWTVPNVIARGLHFLYCKFGYAFLNGTTLRG